MLWRFEVVCYQAVGTALFCLFWIQMLCDCWMGLLENISLSDHSSLEVWKTGGLLGWSVVIAHSHFLCNLLGWCMNQCCASLLTQTAHWNFIIHTGPHKTVNYNHIMLSFFLLIGSIQAMHTCVVAFSLITSGFLLCSCLNSKVLWGFS